MKRLCQPALVGPLLLLAAIPVFAQCPTGTLYPGALDTNASLTVAKNNLVTTLTVQQQIADTVAIVASTTGWVANQMAAVDTGAAIEYEFVTSVSGANTLNVSRACEGSTAVIHLAGAPVDNNATAYSGHTSVAGAAIAIETALGANLANVPGSASGGNVPSTKGGTGTASPAAHAVAVAEGSSPFNFVAPGTAGQVLTSNGASADPTYQAVTTLPSGTQFQYLRLQPNTSNNTTTQWNSLPTVQAADYAFGSGMTTAAYSCNAGLTCAPGGSSGGSLIVGNNTLTMTPVPQGVNGSDVGHRLYVSGGTGTAEGCLISGGAGTAGQTSGAIIINCANTHSGAFTIQTATGGGAEAQQALSGTGGTIVFTVSVTFHAAINGITGTPVRFVGTGDLGQASGITRGSDYASGDIFSFNGGAGVTFENMQIKGGIGSSVTGANIHVVNSTLRILNTYMENSQYGVQCNPCLGSGAISGLIYVQNDYSFTPSAALFFGGGSGDMFVTNLLVTGSSLGNANSVGSAIDLQGTDTITVTNSQLSAAKQGILIDGTVAASFNVNDSFSNIEIIDTVNYGILAAGNADVCTNLVFSGISIQGDNLGVASGTGQNYGINWGGGAASSCLNAEFSGGNVTGFFAHGILIGASSVSVQNFTIFDNNKGNTAGQSGISINTGQTNTVITGNHIYNTAAGHQVDGILLSGTFTGTIVGNDLSGNATAPIAIGGQIAGVMANNKGISDVIGSVADAATIVFPFNSDFIITGVGTGVTAVTMTNVPSGQAGILRTTGGAITFTAGGGIGNTCTTTQNVPVPWIWDGTSVWLKC